MLVFYSLASVFILVILTLALRPLFTSHHKKSAALISACSVLLVAGLYWQFGNPNAIIAKATPVETAQTVEQLLQQLKTVVEQQPKNAEARILLAQSYVQLERYAEAQVYFSEALTLQPKNASLMIDYAEALFRSNRSDAPNQQSLLWIEKALAIEPNNQRGQFFKGVLLFQNKQMKAAAEIWQKLLPQLDEATANALIPQINAARQQAGLSVLKVIPAKRLEITVVLDDRLVNKTPPGSVLFVFAKDPSKAGPPIAAKRIEISKFPVQLQLSEADSIMPTEKLFSQTQFVVSARISNSNSANAGTQIWQSEPFVVQSNQLTPLTLRLHAND